jgi:arginine-tRNA-protein transferase
VDAVPKGLSAIYFFYDPEERRRALGTYNVLRLIEECRARGLPHLYLGYFVEGCASLAYKARFAPNEIRTPEGKWVDFRP